MSKLLAVSMAVLCGGHTCLASWAYVPQAQRVAEADLIVVGKITHVEDGPAGLSIGTITVSEVLKGDAGVKTARLAFAGRKGPVHSAMVTHREGQEGVWILRHDPELNVHRADYPTDFQGLNRRSLIAADIRRVDAVEWGPAVDGLSMGILVNHQSMKGAKVRVRGKPMKAAERLGLLVFVRNQGERALNVLESPQDAPLSVKMTDPRNETVPVLIYPQYSKPRPIQAQMVKVVAPGRTKLVRYCLLPMSPLTGTFRIQTTYRNQLSADHLKLGPMWKGEISSPVVREQVPQSQR